MIYLTDVAAPPPAWRERDLPTPYGEYEGGFYGVGSLNPCPFDIGKADRVFGFDPEGKEQEFENMPTSIVCRRGGIYGISNDWIVVKISTKLVTVDEDDQEILISKTYYHVVRWDTPGVRTILRLSGRMTYCGLPLVITSVDVTETDFWSLWRYLANVQFVPWNKNRHAVLTAQQAYETLPEGAEILPYPYGEYA